MADSTDLAQDVPDTVPEYGETRRRRRRVLRRAGVAVAGLAAATVTGLWLARERIADTLIADQLRQSGLRATYDIESIGPGAEVLRHVVIGDPARPDLVIDRVEVRVAYGFGLPRIGRITLEKARLYGTYRDGRASFGALDKVLFGPPSGEPFRLPDYDLALVDARGLIDSDFGRLAFRADGAGRLRDGFAGTLAAVMPQASVQGCRVDRATLYGGISVKGERPRMAGPLRMAGLRCDDSRLAFDRADLRVDAQADRDLAGATFKGKLRGDGLALASTRAESLTLDGALAWRDGLLSGRVVGNAGGVRASGAAIGLLGVDGLVRARASSGAVEFRGNVEGQGLRQGPALDQALASARASAEGTLVAPMIAQTRAALRREERGSRFVGQISYKQEGDRWSFVVPDATLRGGSGEALLALAKVQVAGGAKGTPRLAGDFTTGGEGVPRIEGRMERGSAGGALFHLSMEEYRAGGGALEIPQMVVAQVGDGSLGFSGTARLSGAIPGGSARNLQLPVSGAYSSRGELALYRRCITPRFDGLTLGQMVLDGRAVTICPPGGGTIVRAGAGGVHVNAGVDALALSGRFGDTPMRMASGPVGFAWPGTLTAQAVDVALGDPKEPTRFRLHDLVARVGKDFTGTFGGVEARLAAVPLDLTNAGGAWRYADSRLTLTGGHFDLTDRAQPARFERLIARDATLTLHDNRIEAEALLREPKSDRAVVLAQIGHDLGNAVGHANLKVDGLVFDKAMQPGALTSLTYGVVANVAGKLDGTGRIDWNPRTVTSSGRFTTAGMDLAAAFGPARGISGTIEFTDLLNMVTAPDQTLRVAAINPGIEVTDGVIVLGMEEGNVLRLHRATWPFLGGTLRLEPTVLRFSIAEPRRYTLAIEGADAATFLQRLEMGNLAATGTFDGRLPLVFDDRGGHIEGGALVSRPPGGNVSYVGALTYKDLGAMGNFAFSALKSIDYKTMTIDMRGDLAGDLVTSVRFGGVKQGLGARQNFLTRKVAALPILFNVNIRAPFYGLVTSVKSFYDPTYVQDPRTLGLVDAQGRPVRRLTNNVSGITVPDIQRPASGNLP